MNKDQKILVTGIDGQLGYDCVKELKNRGYINIFGTSKKDLDITQKDNVDQIITSYKPDVIMHNAAFTNVNLAEELPNMAFDVNVQGTKNIVDACQNINAKMLYISTDYVFDGQGNIPFEVDHPKNPLSIYGKTKSDGEDYVMNTLEKYFIVRTSWVFGINGNNFVKKILDAVNKGQKEFNIVCDQIGSVTYSKDLASLLCDMIETDKYGIYHATNEGFLSWATFAEKIIELSHNTDVKINRITTEEQSHIINTILAKRPLNSRLSKISLDKNGFKRLPKWEDSLKKFLLELGDQNEK